MSSVKAVSHSAIRNRTGSLAQVSAAIASCQANIHNLVMRMASPDFHKLIFEIIQVEEVEPLRVLTQYDALIRTSAAYKEMSRSREKKLPRFAGGAVGFLGYDVVRSFEPTVPSPEKDVSSMPLSL